jgi:dynein-related subfamily AAA family protein
MPNPLIFREVTIARAAVLIRYLIEKRHSVHLWGAPGIGKSDVTRQIAVSLGWKLIEFRANLRETVDLRGIPVADPVTGVTRWLVPDELPREDRDGKYGILFLDELNTASPQMQAALFQLVLERKLGDYTLPDGWVIVAAGNRVSDRAAAQRMPTALRNRFAHVYVVADVDAWANWAVANNVAVEMIAFVRFRRELIHRMPAGDENAFPTPRSLTKAAEFVDAPIDVRRDLIAAHIGDDCATEVEGFLQLYASLGSLEDIVANPETAAVPTEPSQRFAVCTGLARLATRKNFPQIMKYAHRLDGEGQVLLVHDATVRDEGLKNTAVYSKWAVDNDHLIMQS